VTIIRDERWTDVVRTLNDIFSRAADCADRILKGAKPAELPIQAPTWYELAIKSARR